MSKLDNIGINNIRMLSLDMINEARSGDTYLALSSSSVFYSLFMYHLKSDNNNLNWMNRDRIVFSNNFLPAYYSTLYAFGFDMKMDNLRDFKKYGSKTLSYYNEQINDLVCDSTGDTIGYATGIALGERYLNNISNKTNLIDFNTYAICTYNDIMSASSYEALSYISKEKLNKLVIILLKDKHLNDSDADLVYTENIINRFKALDFNIINVDEAKFNQIDEAIDDAKENKKPSIVIINADYKHYNLTGEYKNLHNEPLNDEDLTNLRKSYSINNQFNISKDILKDIRENFRKRTNKIINKWLEIKNNSLKDEKLVDIIKLFEKDILNINFNYDNLKINETYNEELLIGNSKIFNIFANKSPFILNLSDDNYKNTLCSINKSNMMSINTPMGRNIFIGKRTNLLGPLSIGLSYLKLKVFVSTPLINSDRLRSYIKFSAKNILNVTYIFTSDNLLDTYENNGVGVFDEIDSLRIIPNLITFRPCDIDEIIGIYGILKKINSTSVILLSNEKLPKLSTTSPKYVMAGIYRVYKETDKLNGILISSGPEVHTAVKIANDLTKYNIYLRVLSAPSVSLFETQTEKYQNMLMPKNIKTFVLEYNTCNYWNKYATDESYIIGLNNYPTNGTRNELLKHNKLDIDSIKTKIVEKYKS